MKRVAQVLVVLFLMAVVVSCATSSAVEEPQQKEEKEFVPTPLVIDTEKKVWEPQGYFYGTIVIEGTGVETVGYEGAMFIEMDGKYIRISCTEAVRSNYGDNF